MKYFKKTGDSMRICQIVRLEPGNAKECEESFRSWRASSKVTQDESFESWRAFEKAIREVGIRNYSIFLRDRNLFIYFEYVGPSDEFDNRMEQLENAPLIQEHLLKIGMPLKTQAKGEWRFAMQLLRNYTEAEEWLAVEWLAPEMKQLVLERRAEEWLEDHLVFHQD